MDRSPPPSVDRLALPLASERAGELLLLLLLLLLLRLTDRLRRKLLLVDPLVTLTLLPRFCVACR
jgi:hypothetical protein